LILGLDWKKEKDMDTEENKVEETINPNSTVIETEDEIKIPVLYENAEEALLGIFMQDDDAATYIAQSGLRDIHFLKRSNRLLYPIILNVRLKKGACNIDLVADECEKVELPTQQTLLELLGGVEGLSVMLNSPVALDLKTTQGYVDIVYEQYNLSKTKDVARYLLSLKKFDDTKIVDKVSTLQSILVDGLNKQGLVSADILASDSYARFEDRREHPEKYVGVKTGFYYLDKNKAVSKKRVTVLGARTSVGKSIMSSNMITPMMFEGTKVLVFTPELDKEEYIDRIICAAAKVSIDKWKDTNLNPTELDRIVKIGNKIREIAPQNLWIEDKGTQTASFVLNSIKRHMLNHQVDVVVIDYLQKLKYYTDAKKAMTDMMDKFCSFAKDNNIAIIVISQLRRSEEAEPQLSELKESGDIENFSDCVVLLHRNSITKIKEREQGWYMIAKNRQGSTTDAVPLKFNPNYLLFEETETPPDEGVGEFQSYLVDEPDAHPTEINVMGTIAQYDKELKSA
jgi:replicative DNA helicase